ncbi:MAG: lytic murein transglycosylase [Rickettsiales bacterium]|nr:lytic murein transglycosylase [Rickettsiales bacterium]
MLFRSVYLIGVLVVLMFGVSAQAQDDAFEAWLVKFKSKASAQGISKQTLEEALAGIEPDETVVKLDRKQPEGQITIEQYLNNTISDRRIRIGREMLREHAALLDKVSKRYGVEPKYIVALWGIESDFGNHQGNFSTIQSLATLAYEGRRAEFFSNELIAALKILESEKLPRDELTGSWAGAMGNCQFIPSTFLRYAVDADGDGHRDIWNNTADTFASIANYLHALGWDASLEVMTDAVTPDDFKASEASIDKAQSADYWHKRGFSVSYGNGMARVGGPRMLYAIYLSKADEADANTVLVTDNFKALLQWNRSRYFAAAVSKLADAIEDQ